MDRAKDSLRRRLRAARSARAAAGESSADGLGPPSHRAGLTAGPARLLATALRAGLLDPDGRIGQLGAARIAAYLAMPGEPDPALITAAVREAGGRVLLPVPLADRTMAWAVDDGSRSEARDPVRVPVPAGPRVGVGARPVLAEVVTTVLLPALAVDETGGRLGQGGGFYDRFLSELATLRVTGRRGPLVVAVVHDDEVLPVGTVPVRDHDRAVDAVLTPTRFMRF